MRLKWKTGHIRLLAFWILSIAIVVNSIIGGTYEFTHREQNRFQKEISCADYMPPIIECATPLFYNVVFHWKSDEIFRLKIFWCFTALREFSSVVKGLKTCLEYLKSVISSLHFLALSWSLFSAHHFLTCVTAFWTWLFAFMVVSCINEFPATDILKF